MQLCPVPEREEMSTEFGSLVINHVPAVDVPLTKGWSRDTTVWVTLQSFPQKSRREELRMCFTFKKVEKLSQFFG